MELFPSLIDGAVKREQGKKTARSSKKLSPCAAMAEAKAEGEGKVMMENGKNMCGWHSDVYTPTRNVFQMIVNIAIAHHQKAPLLFFLPRSEPAWKMGRKHTDTSEGSLFSRRASQYLIVEEEKNFQMHFR